VLSGPLLLFNPWLVSLEQGRHGVAAALGTDQAGVDRVTAAMLGDLFLNGEFAQSLDGEAPILDATERSHMRDVGGLVRTLLLLEVTALVVLVLAAALVVAVERPRLGQRFGAQARRARERKRRKSQLRVVTPEDESDEFIRSVQRDLDALPTIEERDRKT